MAHDHHHDAEPCGGETFTAPDFGLRLDHVNLRTARLDRLVDWYVAILGMTPGPRPDFPFPGAWLYAGGAPVLHLVGVDAEPSADPDALKLEHFALAGRDLDAFLGHLHAMGETFRLGRLPGGVVTQVNLWDPDGNHVHVDFATPGV